MVKKSLSCKTTRDLHLRFFTLSASFGGWEWMQKQSRSERKRERQRRQAASSRLRAKLTSSNPNGARFGPTGGGQFALG